MSVLTRRLLTVPVLVIALGALAAGCSGPEGAAPASSSASPPPVMSPSSSLPASGGGAAATVAASAPAAPAPGAGRVVYLAGSGSVNGKLLHEPACRPDCVLSGDSTTALYGMTWQRWDADRAAGTGTERLVDCTPDCATGRSYAVPVTVTLSRPVLTCAGGARRWLWTRLAFTWPHGLPAAFGGDNKPVNPWDLPGITPAPAGACPA